MAVIRPFKGYRPAVEYAREVASPPYDVLSTEEAREILDRNPMSFLQVIKSEATLPEDTDPYSKAVYEQARRNFEKMVEDGILIQDQRPCLYIYRQRMGTHIQTGLVAASSVKDYFDDVIKKHEHTRPEKELDRTTHMKVTGIHSGPVFLTYPEIQAVDAIIHNICSETPVYDFVAEDGVQHSVWVIRDEAIIEELQYQFQENVPYTYIADGHHRAASSAKVGLELAGGEPAYNDAPYNYFLTVLFPANQLQIIDYNRVVADLNGLSLNGFLKKLEKTFTVESSAGPVKPGRLHEFGMYAEGQWFRLKAKSGTFNEEDPVEKLDASILQKNLFDRVLGIKDPRTDKRIDFIGGIRGLTELEKRVDSGEMAAAFALYPVSIRQLIDIADSGRVMPPKSTWFEPKLRSGLVIHKFK